MKSQTDVPFVDTIIIPDRNAGMGSLLLDLQNPQDPDLDGLPLLGPEFAFIDVGVSHARVSTTLKTILAKDFRMKVDYIATQLIDVVPYANVTPLRAGAEKIRTYLSGMISTTETIREVVDWYYVVDVKGMVSSLSYSYYQHGNEVWESYYMGRPFLISGEKVEFHDPTLDDMVAEDVQKIEARIDLDRKSDSDLRQPEPYWDGYRMKKKPLEAGLAEFGITLQKTDVPQRIMNRQNVLFLGNVLNHYPKDTQAFELDRITANMQEGDIVIVQVDEVETSYIEVLLVKAHGARKTRERVRWINTIKLEVRKPFSVSGSFQQLNLKPGLDKVMSRLIDCLARKVNSPEWHEEDYKLHVRQTFYQVFGTFFRALPVEETLRIAIREVLYRLPINGDLNGIPVFKDDTRDVHGGSTVPASSPIVSEADISNALNTLLASSMNQMKR